MGCRTRVLALIPDGQSPHQPSGIQYCSRVNCQLLFQYNGTYRIILKHMLIMSVFSHMFADSFFDLDFF